MIIEHIGLAVTAPHTMAAWYIQHLGFHMRRSGGSDQDGWPSSPSRSRR
jgi:catechol-2,3-dioxygenase